MSKTALIVGSSPSVAHYIKAAFDQHRSAVTYTANGGYALFIAHGRTVDVYYCGDHKALRLFHCYLDLHGGRTLEPDGQHRWSLQLMILDAIEHGCDEIVLVGCDWYSDVLGQPAYFDGRWGKEELQDTRSAREFGTWLRRVKAQHPQIRFKTYGVPPQWERYTREAAA